MALDLNSTDDDSTDDEDDEVHGREPAPAAEPQDQTEPDSEDGVETEAWVEPPPAEAPPEAKPASSYVFMSPLDTRKRERDADDADDAAGAAGAVRPRRRARATSSRGQAWKLKDAEAFALIKEQERTQFTAAAAQELPQGTTLEASKAAFEQDPALSDLEDNCECDPDGDYKPPAHVRKSKRQRTGTMPADVEIIDLCGDS
jgi:hypothetical protein